MFEQPLSKELCSTNSWRKPGMRRWSHGGDSGCPLGQVVTVNCPVLSSAMFLCGIGCFGVILLHCSVVEMQGSWFRKGTCIFLRLEGKTKMKWKAKIVLGFTMWAWRVCPEHGANTAFWSSAPLITNSSSDSGDGLYLQVQWVHSFASVMVWIWSKSLA